MQVVVEDDTDRETLVTFSFVQLCSVTFSYVQLHSVMFSYIQLCSATFRYVQFHAVPLSCMQFIHLTTQLETVKLSELMEGAWLKIKQYSRC